MIYAIVKYWKEKFKYPRAYFLGILEFFKRAFGKWGRG
jgi:hypothetical protein